MAADAISSTKPEEIPEAGLLMIQFNGGGHPLVYV
jgi:hypothetical protein